MNSKSSFKFQLNTLNNGFSKIYDTMQRNSSILTNTNLLKMIGGPNIKQISITNKNHLNTQIDEVDKEGLAKFF